MLSLGASAGGQTSPSERAQNESLKPRAEGAARHLTADATGRVTATGSVLLAIQPRVRALSGLVPRVGSQMRPIPTREAHQHIFLENKLFP